MLSARYSPLISQAEITGKAQPDLWSFNHRQAHSGDSMYIDKSYTGDDMSIMPGELVIGYRKRVGHASFHGRSQECGFSSVAKLDYSGHETPESLMRDFYFMGVAKTEYQYGGESLFGTDPMDHGFGFLRAGSMSIVNNSAQDVYAGDILAWRLPAFKGAGDPRSQGNGGHGRSLDTGLNPRLSRNRTGTPYGKPLVQIERFDPTDFSFQLAGAYALFRKPASQGGVSDLGPNELFETKKNLSSLQEEALGWKWGLLMAYARGKDAEVAGSGKAFMEREMANKELSATALNILDSMFLRNVAPGQNMTEIGKIRVEYDSLRPGSYEFYADHLFDMLCGGVAGGWYAKASRVIGKAMGNAKSSQTLDVMFSHFKVGF